MDHLHFLIFYMVWIEKPFMINLKIDISKREKYDWKMMFYILIWLYKGHKDETNYSINLVDDRLNNKLFHKQQTN